MDKVSFAPKMCIYARTQDTSICLENYYLLQSNFDDDQSKKKMNKCNKCIFSIVV